MSMDDPKTFGRSRLSFAKEAEVDTFVSMLSKFESGQIGPDEWRSFRLVHGAYGQRQPPGSERGVDLSSNGRCASRQFFRRGLSDAFESRLGRRFVLRGEKREQLNCRHADRGRGLQSGSAHRGAGQARLRAPGPSPRRGVGGAPDARRRHAGLTL